MVSHIDSDLLYRKSAPACRWIAGKLRTACEIFCTQPTGVSDACDPNDDSANKPSLLLPVVLANSPRAIPRVTRPGFGLIDCFAEGSQANSVSLGSVAVVKLPPRVSEQVHEQYQHTIFYEVPGAFQTSHHPTTLQGHQDSVQNTIQGLQKSNEMGLPIEETSVKVGSSQPVTENSALVLWNKPQQQAMSTDIPDVNVECEVLPLATKVPRIMQLPAFQRGYGKPQDNLELSDLQESSVAQELSQLRDLRTQHEKLINEQKEELSQKDRQCARQKQIISDAREMIRSKNVELENQSKVISDQEVSLRTARASNQQKDNDCRNAINSRLHLQHQHDRLCFEGISCTQQVDNLMKQVGGLMNELYQARRSFNDAMERSIEFREEAETSSNKIEGLEAQIAEGYKYIKELEEARKVDATKPQEKFVLFDARPGSSAYTSLIRRKDEEITSLRMEVSKKAGRIEELESLERFYLIERDRFLQYHDEMKAKAVGKIQQCISRYERELEEEHLAARTQLDQDRARSQRRFEQATAEFQEREQHLMKSIRLMQDAVKPYGITVSADGHVQIHNAQPFSFTGNGTNIRSDLRQGTSLHQSNGQVKRFGNMFQFGKPDNGDEIKDGRQAFTGAAGPARSTWASGQAVASHGLMSPVGSSPFLADSSSMGNPNVNIYIKATETPCRKHTKFDFPAISEAQSSREASNNVAQECPKTPRLSNAGLARGGEVETKEEVSRSNATDIQREATEVAAADHGFQEPHSHDAVAVVAKTASDQSFAEEEAASASTNSTPPSVEQKYSSKGTSPGSDKENQSVDKGKLPEKPLPKTGVLLPAAANSTPRSRKQRRKAANRILAPVGDKKN